MCSLTISAIRGIIDALGNLTSIIITGTVEECREIIIYLEQDGSRQGPFRHTVTADGSWRIEIPHTFQFVCDKTIKADVNCETDPACSASRTEVLNCETPIPPTVPCPDEISFLSPSFEECDELGNKTATIPVEVTPASSDSVTVVLEDDAGRELTRGSGMTIFRIVATITRPAGSSIRVRARSISSSGCTRVSEVIDFPPCADTTPIPSCPHIRLDLGEPSACREGSTRRSVTATVTQTGTETINAELRVFRIRDDGTFEDLGLTRSGEVRMMSTESLTITNDFEGGWSLLFRVNLISHIGCTPTSTSITIPSCTTSPPPPPPPVSREETGCMILRWVMAILAALAILAVFIGICIPATVPIIYYVAAGLAIGALIIGLIWGFVCPNKPCNWGLLFASQVALAVGYAALYFSGCCTWMLAVGLGFLALGIGLFIAWKESCRVTWCRVAREAAAVLVSVVLPLIGYVLLAPGASSCVEWWIAAGLSTLVALLTAYALACDETRD